MLLLGPDPPHISEGVGSGDIAWSCGFVMGMMDSAIGLLVLA